MVVLLAAFMDFIDVTIVVIAAPVIQDDLGASYAGVQWLLAGVLGFVLSFALPGRARRDEAEIGRAHV